MSLNLFCNLFTTILSHRQMSNAQIALLKLNHKANIKFAQMEQKNWWSHLPKVVEEKNSIVNNVNSKFNILVWTRFVFSHVLRLKLIAFHGTLLSLFAHQILHVFGTFFGIKNKSIFELENWQSKTLRNNEIGMITTLRCYCYEITHREV